MADVDADQPEGSTWHAFEVEALFTTQAAWLAMSSRNGTALLLRRQAGSLGGRGLFDRLTDDDQYLAQFAGAIPQTADGIPDFTFVNGEGDLGALWLGNEEASGRATDDGDDSPRHDAQPEGHASKQLEPTVLWTRHGRLSSAAFGGRQAANLVNECATPILVPGPVRKNA